VLNKHSLFCKPCSVRSGRGNNSKDVKILSEYKKKITQFKGEELVNEVVKTLTCPFCGLECESSYEVYAHISAAHASKVTVGDAS